MKKAGLESQFQVKSAATSTEELSKTTRQLMNSDYVRYDLLIGMDQANLRNMHRICGSIMWRNPKSNGSGDCCDSPGTVLRRLQHIWL